MKIQNAAIAFAICLSLTALLSSCPQSIAQTPTCGSGYLPIEAGHMYSFHFTSGLWSGQGRQTVEELLPDGWIRCTDGWCLNMNHVDFIKPEEN